MMVRGINLCPWAHSCIFGITVAGWGRRTCGRDHFDCPVYFGFNWGWRSFVNELAWADVVGRATSDDPYYKMPYMISKVFKSFEGLTLDEWCAEQFGAAGWSP